MPVAKVKKVIDGDTIVIKNNTTIRIANLDAPELEAPGGKTAKRKLQKKAFNPSYHFIHKKL